MHTQLFVSGPNRSGRAGPNSALDLDPAAAAGSPPTRPRPRSASSAAAARAGSQWATGQQGMGLEREPAGGGLDEPAPADAAELRGEGRGAPAGRARSRSCSRRSRTRRRRTVSPRQRRPARTGPGSRGAGGEVDAGDVEPGLERAQADVRRSRRRGPARPSGRRVKPCEEARACAAGASAGRRAGRAARRGERADAAVGVDVGARSVGNRTPTMVHGLRAADPRRRRPDRRRGSRRGPDDDEDRDRERRGDAGPDPPRRRGGADIVRCAVPREQDAEALRTIVAQSPIPVIADIHFNHTLALKAIDAGAHCVRLNPGNIGGPDKVAEVVARAKQLGTPLRIGVNSGSLPKHLRELEYENPVEALVDRRARDRRADGAAATSRTSRSRSSRPRAEHDRLQPPALRADPLPAAPRGDRGRDEVVGVAEVRRRAGHAARRRDRRHDPDLAVDLPRRGGGQGRLGDPQGAEAA